jgi:hypothetical protein
VGAAAGRGRLAGFATTRSTADPFGDASAARLGSPLSGLAGIVITAATLAFAFLDASLDGVLVRLVAAKALRVGKGAFGEANVLGSARESASRKPGEVLGGSEGSRDGKEDGGVLHFDDGFFVLWGFLKKKIFLFGY